MISFRLDGRSVVPPYLQIVQQVRQALRMGVLDVGDKLPTVPGSRRGHGDQPQHRAQGLPRPGARGPGRAPGRSWHVRGSAGRPARLPARTRGWPAAWPNGCAAPARPGWTTSRSNRCCASRCRRRPRRRSRDGHSGAVHPVIETRGLSKRYRKVTALTDCTITVPEGRISALIGPNGAGKTTLLRAAQRAGQANRRRRRGTRRHAAPGPGLPRRHRLPGPGDPAVPALHRRGSHRRRRAPQPPLGRRVRAAAAEKPGHPA